MHLIVCILMLLFAHWFHLTCTLIVSNYLLFFDWLLYTHFSSVIDSCPWFILMKDAVTRLDNKKNQLRENCRSLMERVRRICNLEPGGNVPEELQAVSTHPASLGPSFIKDS